MEEDKALVVFQGKQIRRIWFNDDWWFSVVDIIGSQTQTDRARKYWSYLKVKLVQEGFEVSERIGQLKLMADDGKCMTPSQYKNFKGLKRENLRDHMDDLELIFTMLGEAATTRITKSKDAIGLEENKVAARQGGEVAGNARKELEEKTGESVLTEDNFLYMPEKLSKKRRKMLQQTFFV